MLCTSVWIYGLIFHGYEPSIIIQILQSILISETNAGERKWFPNLKCAGSFVLPNFYHRIKNLYSAFIIALYAVFILYLDIKFWYVRLTGSLIISLFRDFSKDRNLLYSWYIPH